MANRKFVVYSTNRLFEAESVKGHLELNEIPAFILNKMDSTYLFGNIEILVNGDHVMRAKRLIEEFIENE